MNKTSLARDEGTSRFGAFNIAVDEAQHRIETDPICPLCSSSNTKRKETISAAELNLLYQNAFGISNAVRSPQLEYWHCRDCRLGFFWPMETGSEELYERLQEFDWYYMSDKAEYRMALELLPPTGSVLEVGAGRAAFASMVGVERYTGLEFNDRAIEEAGKAGIHLLKEAVERHAERGRRYQSVVSFQVLEHVASPFDFLKGCVDCMCCGGILIIAVPSEEGFAGEASNNLLNMPPHHVTHWSIATLSRLARMFGLQLLTIEHEPVAPYHREWAREVRIQAALRKLTGTELRLLDNRLRARVISRIASALAPLFPLPAPKSSGHTVLASYRKLCTHTPSCTDCVQSFG